MKGGVCRPSIFARKKRQGEPVLVSTQHPLPAWVRAFARRLRGRSQVPRLLLNSLHQMAKEHHPNC